MIKTEGWFTDFSRLVVQQPLCSYNLEDTIMYSYAKWYSVSQVSHPVMLPHWMQTFLATFLGANFYSCLMPDKGDRQPGLLTVPQTTPSPERCTWHLATSPLPSISTFTNILAGWTFCRVLKPTQSSFQSLGLCTCSLLYLKCSSPR